MSSRLREWAEQQPEFTQYEHDNRPDYIGDLISRWPSNKALLEELQDGNAQRIENGTGTAVRSGSSALAHRIHNEG